GGRGFMISFTGSIRQSTRIAELMLRKRDQGFDPRRIKFAMSPAAENGCTNSQNNPGSEYNSAAFSAVHSTSICSFVTGSTRYQLSVSAAQVVILASNASSGST